MREELYRRGEDQREIRNPESRKRGKGEPGKRARESFSEGHCLWRVERAGLGML